MYKELAHSGSGKCTRTEALLDHATLILRNSELLSMAFISGANSKIKQMNKPQEVIMCTDPIKIV